ncbi:DUF5710 domain-containing protein [Streptomyces sp. NPDC057694]|uniref:DUF5710 domain-containing protein n=1 Tax=Streptomyces sp. NPDC057694 TaxID=3346216 RepID=UPI0036915994
MVRDGRCLYLNVPYERKDDAKRLLRARWDKVARHWWVDAARPHRMQHGTRPSTAGRPTPKGVTWSLGSGTRSHRMDPEVGGHLLDRYARAAVPRDPHDVLAELLRIRLGHSDILPTRPTGQASSDVIRSCSRLLQDTRLPAVRVFVPRT